LAADSMLHLPDFRSSERTFQLLTQVSGRAGRHELEGKVIIQTYTPDHYSIKFASNYHYLAFFEHEMKIRRTFAYPPYFYLELFTISHENEQKAYEVAQNMRTILESKLNPRARTIVLGPSPSPIARMKNRYRFQLVFKYRREPQLHAIINNMMEQLTEERKEVQ